MKRFGFDLDNTLIDYSRSCEQYTKQRGLPICANIKDLRKMLKPDELESSNWTLAQSWIYGKGLQYAVIEAEVIPLLKSLVNKGWQVSIHSHKTKFGPVVYGSVPLREMMIDWIENSSLSDFFAINQNLNFYDDLDSKVKGIASQNLNCYVDDLAAVFLHSNYPRHIKSYLYQGTELNLDWLVTIKSFKDIYHD